MSVRKRPISRRRFLRQAVGAAVGVASLPAIVPSSVFGMLAPSQRITLGFIGVGKQGTYLLRAFLNEPGTMVLAVCDVDALKLKRARELTDQYYSEQSAAGSAKVCKPYRDFRQLLARDDIDAVVIATPDHVHVPASVMALKMGKHCYT
ncbi:MAG: gfo/Idh/MocA family oxidoreductase, partial [Calditrichaeota bacterium]|nr:gfo/Idh/MocA family oxidoreductase [Calditrichota bacterium]